MAVVLTIAACLQKTPAVPMLQRSIPLHTILYRTKADAMEKLTLFDLKNVIK
jgi:hypothetical protein